MQSSRLSRTRPGTLLTPSWSGEAPRTLLPVLTADSQIACSQKEYFDEPVADESPKQTKARLAKLAFESVGVDESKFIELVSTAKGNSGSGVTNDLKLQVKLGR